MLDITTDERAGASLTFTQEPHPGLVDANERARLLENPGFGRVFTDHMVTIRYSDEKGWHDARVQPRAPSRWMPPLPCCITRKRFSRA